MPLVSIVTATWQRHESLFNTCIPSVLAQTYTEIEHVIISDGPDPVLRDRLKGHPASFYELGRNFSILDGTESRGAVARSVGARMARGDFIGYLDDDDEYLPHHASSMVNLLEESGADWGFSRMTRDFREFGDDSVYDVIGDGHVGHGHIGTPMIFHRPHVLRNCDWHSWERADDWAFIQQLVAGGYKHAWLNDITIRVHMTEFYWRAYGH